MFAVNGIMFNHESPRRGETFVTRKITRAVARIEAGMQECLYLGKSGGAARLGLRGRLRRGDVADDASAEPDDYVIATGESHSVREFCELAFELAGVPITWRGTGVEEVGVDARECVRVRIDPRYFRPAEVDIMQGDASYAAEDWLETDGGVRRAGADYGRSRYGAGECLRNDSTIISRCFGFGRIPKGLHPSAQGWPPLADYPGSQSHRVNHQGSGCRNPGLND